MLILRGHGDAVRCLSYSPDGRYLASGSEDKTVRLWNLSAGGALEAALEHSSSVEALAFAPDDPILMTGTSEGDLFAWELTSRRPLTSLQGHNEGVRCLFHTSDIGDGEKLVTSGWDRRVLAWEYPTFQQGLLLPDVPACVVLSWEPKQRTLAIGEGDSSLALYDLDARITRSRTGLQSPLCTLAWSPDGQLLALGHSDGIIRLLPLPIDNRSTTLRGHTWTVYSLAFTPDGHTLLSGGADGTVRVWNVRTAQEQHCFRWHKSWVTCVAVAPDGMTAAAGSADHTIAIWDLDE